MVLDFSRLHNSTDLTTLFPFSIPFDFARAINSLLGHAKVSTTQNIYAHFIAQADEQAAESDY